MNSTHRSFVAACVTLLSASCSITSSSVSDDASAPSGDAGTSNEAAVSSDAAASNDVSHDAPTTNDGGTSVVVPPSSGFDDSDDGWTVVGDAQTQTSKPDYNGMGGNPDGLISAKDDVTGGTWYFQAPAKYLGDQSPAYGGNLEFDLKTTDVSNPFDDYDVVLVGAGKVLAYDTPMNPTTASWTSYRIGLTETSGWKEIASETTAWSSDFASLPAPSAEDFKAVLADVTRLRIRGEFNDGADTGFLDNVKLGATD